MQSPKSSKRAFSIAQIAITLTLLALVSSLAIPAWFGRSSVTLDNAAIVMARDLRNAQNRAAFERRPTHLVFGEDGSGYRVIDESGSPVPAPLGPGDYVRSFGRDAVFRGVRVESARFSGIPVAKYDSRGALVGGEGEVVLSFAGDSRTLRVDSRTGLIQLEGMHEAWIDNGL